LAIQRDEKILAFIYTLHFNNHLQDYLPTHFS